MFDGIVPGTCSITVAAAGFSTLSSTGNVVTIAQFLVFNRALQVGAAATRVKLRDEASRLRRCIRPFVGREFLLAMMSSERACSYKPIGRRRPFSDADCRHAVVTVGPSGLTGADLGG